MGIFLTGRHVVICLPSRHMGRTQCRIQVLGTDLPRPCNQSTSGCHWDGTPCIVQSCWRASLFSGLNAHFCPCAKHVQKLPGIRSLTYALTSCDTTAVFLTCQVNLYHIRLLLLKQPRQLVEVLWLSGQAASFTCLFCQDELQLHKVARVGKQKTMCG